MKARELIEKLGEFDPEMEVWVKDHVEGNDYELTEVDESQVETGENNVVLLG